MFHKHMWCFCVPYWRLKMDDDDERHPEPVVQQPRSRNGRTLEEIQAESNQIVDEDLDSTRRMRNLVHSDVELNQKTLEELQTQGEQLHRVERGLDNINEDTRRAEKELTAMEKCCGLCYCSFKKPDSFEERADYKGAFQQRANGVTEETVGPDGQVITEQPTASARGTGAQSAEARRAEKSARAAYGLEEDRYARNIMGDAREDEMNENLGEVHSMLRVLKSQAEAMGGEIDDQNSMLDRINKKAEIDTKRVIATSDRTVNLMRK